MGSAWEGLAHQNFNESSSLDNNMFFKINEVVTYSFKRKCNHDYSIRIIVLLSG